MATSGDISGLDTLSYGGSPLIPIVDGYTHAHKNGVVSSSVAGGTTRQRKKYFGQPHSANVSFYFDHPSAQDYAMWFFNKNEGKYFICHLAVDRPIVEPYVVQVIGEVSFDRTSQADGMASMQFEVVQARDECMDEWIDLSSCYNGNMACDVSQVIEAWPS